MMLQNQAYQEQLAGDDLGQLFSPAYIFALIKRRALYFLIPFMLVFTIGAVVALAWPAKYLAEGKILVQSQEIPSDLVRPTVVSLANERIQVIEQRIMTRDNLLAIAKKFQISRTAGKASFPERKSSISSKNGPALGLWCSRWEVTASRRSRLLSVLNMSSRR